VSAGSQLDCSLHIAFPEVMAMTEVLICTSLSIPEGSLAFHWRNSLQSLRDGHSALSRMRFLMKLLTHVFTLVVLTLSLLIGCREAERLPHGAGASGDCSL
jgi:hypothetical protein